MPCAPAARAVADLPVSIGAAGCDGADAKGRPAFHSALGRASGTTGPRRFDVDTGNGCVRSGTTCGGQTCGGQTCVPCAGTCRGALRSCRFGNRPRRRVVSRDRLPATERIAVPVAAA